MARILVVEDDANLAQGLRYNLERAGYEVVHAAKGPEGLRLAREGSPDLVVLDLMLPGLHGFDLLARLRESGSRVPVIILTVQDAEVDKIRGFDAGADDYLTKPFGVGELLARIRARLRKEGDAAEVAVAGGVLRLEALVFERGGERVALTPTEADILRALCRRRGDPVRREDLLRAVWGVADLMTRTLDTHVTRLRRKIEPDPARPRHILTVHGVGYRLVP
jgi:DNA-binding response OmpR family regulator